MLRNMQTLRLNRILRSVANINHNSSGILAAISQHKRQFTAKTIDTDNDESEPDMVAKDAEKALDSFSEEFLKNRIELTTLQKLILSTGSSLASLVDPRRHDMIACLGETTGEAALENMLQSMRGTEEGERILSERPRINTTTIDLNKLSALPAESFGYAYVKFLEGNNVTPDSRMEVRFMSDPDLAYIMTRYRECHDLVHTILDMPTNMLGEVAVKWVEALNNGLPMCYGGAVFGAFRLRPKQRKEYLKRYLPWAIRNGRSMKPLMNVYWEERWQQNICDLRKELNIRTLN